MITSQFMDHKIIKQIVIKQSIMTLFMILMYHFFSLFITIKIVNFMLMLKYLPNNLNQCFQNSF